MFQLGKQRRRSRHPQTHPLSCINSLRQNYAHMLCKFLKNWNVWHSQSSTQALGRSFIRYFGQGTALVACKYLISLTRFPKALLNLNVHKLTSALDHWYESFHLISQFIRDKGHKWIWMPFYHCKIIIIENKKCRDCMSHDGPGFTDNRV